jgi:hypothetical protein
MHAGRLRVKGRTVLPNAKRGVQDLCCAAAIVLPTVVRSGRDQVCSVVLLLVKMMQWDKDFGLQVEAMRFLEKHFLRYCVATMKGILRPVHSLRLHVRSSHGDGKGKQPLKKNYRQFLNLSLHPFARKLPQPV